METLTRVLARHVYSLELSETNTAPEGRGRGRRPAPAPAPRPVPLRRPTLATSDARTPGWFCFHYNLSHNFNWRIPNVIYQGT